MNVVLLIISSYRQWMWNEKVSRNMLLKVKYILIRSLKRKLIQSTLEGNWFKNQLKMIGWLGIIFGIWT